MEYAAFESLVRRRAGPAGGALGGPEAARYADRLRQIYDAAGGTRAADAVLDACADALCLGAEMRADLVGRALEATARVRDAREEPFL